MTRDLVLSASSVNRYLACELAWWFSYVAMEPGEQSWERVIGLSVHTAVERSLGRMLQLKPPYPPAQQNIAAESVLDLNAAFEEETRRGPVAHGKLGYVKAKEEAHRVLAAYWAAFPPDPLPWLVEHPFEIEIDGIAVSGTIDRVEDRRIEIEPTVILRDLKSVASRPPKGRYRLNMMIYWLGLRESKGVEADQIVLDYIVRTKNPYHWPEWIEPPDEDDIAWVANTVSNVAEGIAAGNYRPTGLDSAWECLQCPWRKTCGPRQRYEGNG